MQIPALTIANCGILSKLLQFAMRIKWAKTNTKCFRTPWHIARAMEVLAILIYYLYSRTSIIKRAAMWILSCSKTYAFTMPPEQRSRSFSSPSSLFSHLCARLFLLFLPFHPFPSLFIFFLSPSLGLLLSSFFLSYSVSLVCLSLFRIGTCFCKKDLIWSPVYKTDKPGTVLVEAGRGAWCSVQFTASSPEVLPQDPRTLTDTD